jgi:hypothetical protein
LASLKDIQEYVSFVRSSKKIIIVNTSKNRETRYLLGITVQDQEDIIRGIKVTDYVSGPELDRDSSRTGMIWIFKTKIDKNIIYVKIKIERIGEVKALSCHIDYLGE